MTGDADTEVKEKIALPLDLVGFVYRPEPKERVVVKRKRVSLEGKENSIVDARDYRGNGHWDFPEPLGGKDYVGFIYVIEDTVNKRLYLGKKFFRGAGKLNKGKDSNWRWYITSSKEVESSVKQNKKEGFKFHAIEQYHARGAVSYAEGWSLFHYETPLNRDLWYNVLINEVSWVVKERITDRHKERLAAIVERVKKERVS